MHALMREYLDHFHPGWYITYDNNPWVAAEDLGVADHDVEANVMMLVEERHA